MSLPEPYRIERMDVDSLFLLIKPLQNTIFQTNLRVPVYQFLSSIELDKLKKLQENMGSPFRINLGLFCGQELVGWSYGWQENRETYYMTNSAVVPEHPRKGLYSALLNKTLQIAREEGFQIIYSRHTATNNAVIIPKLKAGFLISSMEISDPFGTLVILRYYCNPKRRALMDFRCGEDQPTSEVKKLLNLMDLDSKGT